MNVLERQYMNELMDYVKVDFSSVCQFLNWLLAWTLIPGCM